ncbi:MAG: helix-turn-helix domain-containing protein, partial [Oceanidesulfovibrio sp.]
LYDWPGNVRELENLVERAFILTRSHELTLDDFPAEFHPAHSCYAEQSQRGVDATLTLAEARERSKAILEKQYLRDVLAQHGGRIDKTAVHAGITPRQLHKLMTRHGLDKKAFK